MGWFSDLWDSVKSTASNVWGGIKKAAGTVYDIVRKPVDVIASAGKLISKVPVLGTIASPLTAAASTAQGILDQAKTVGDVAKSIRLKEGGMVKKYYQA